MSANTTEKDYTVTDELRKKYPDITINVDAEHLAQEGMPPLFMEKFMELLPVMTSAIKDMAIIEAEYMLDKTGLCNMFKDMPGMEDANNYLKIEAFKVAVERNKERVFKQYTDRWNQLAAETNNSSTAPEM